MRCQSCKTPNDAGATTCTACGQTLTRRSRSRRASVDELDNPYSGPFRPANLPALRAFWVGLWSLVPGAGLFLGPLAILLGIRARRRCLPDPDFNARGPLLASLILGGVATLCNWLGFTLMFLGLKGAGSW